MKKAKKKVKRDYHNSVVRSIRIPVDVWEKLAKYADDNRRTTNGEIIVALEHYQG